MPLLDPLPLRASPTSPPGGLLFWVVVATELLAFGVFFGFVAHVRVSEPEVFEAGRALVDTHEGLVLAAVLLTSGWFVAEAVHACRLDRLRRARGYYALAIVAGIVFVGLKLHGYAMLGANARLGVSTYWDVFLLGTGFHFLHVLLGLAMLARTAWRLGRRPFEDAETAIAGTALFWHMCDLAWFFLFPL
ncbi:MAG: cytochrome c oxidase subunit 3, partial [Sandaracinus sp.]|nr:cytochrome c oxidase subunit 3 [Sandaracinus sp.]